MKIWKYTVIFLLLVLVLIVISVFQLPDQNLHVIACDVGQGDAILIVYKNTQILTDGGPDTKVLSCLGRHLPFWDRTLELIISTHPDSDHSTGLTEILKRYKVDKMLVNTIDPGTDVYRLLQTQAQSQKVAILNPTDGMTLRVGLIHLDILSPTDELLNRLTVTNTDSKMAKYSIGAETNLYSIVYRLSFGKFSGLFMGDATPEISDQLAVQQSIGTVQYIKVPHHGSVNGLTQNLLEKIVPDGGLPRPVVGVISVGSKNMWGFPAPAILNMLSSYQVKVLRTDEMGDVEVITDGDKIWWKN